MLQTFLIQKVSFWQINSEVCGLLRFSKNIPNVEYANTDQDCSWSGEVEFRGYQNKFYILKRNEPKAIYSGGVLIPSCAPES